MYGHGVIKPAMATGILIYIIEVCKLKEKLFHLCTFVYRNKLRKLLDL